MKKKNKEKITITKESALIESSREHLTLMQQKAYDLLLKNATTQLRENPHLDCFTIDASEILEFFDIGKKNYQRLKEQLKRLEQEIVEYNLLNKDKTWTFGAFPLLASFEYDHGTITYQLPFQIKNRLLDHKVYATFGLYATKYFKSKYTYGLYQILMDYIYSPQVPTIDFETYKKLVGAKERSYHTYDLVNLIVKRPVEDLNNNKYIPFTVDFEIIRGERYKIEGIKFNLTLKDWFIKRFDDSLVDISQEAKELTTLLPERYQTSLVATIIQGLLDQYGSDAVKEAIEKTTKEKGFLPARIEQYLQEKSLTQQKNGV